MEHIVNRVFLALHLIYIVFLNVYTWITAIIQICCCYCMVRERIRRKFKPQILLRSVVAVENKLLTEQIYPFRAQNPYIQCELLINCKKYFHKNYNTAVPPRTLHLGLVFNMLIPQSTNFVVLQEQKVEFQLMVDIQYHPTLYR